MLKALAIAAMLALMVEIGARLLGLGDPALTITHPTIEYMLAPNQDVSRFGNRVAVNAWGMRSPPLSKTRDARRRVLVLGDSVLNGGNRTDHGELATTLLSRDGVLYLNASAISWGPQNMLAYVDQYGFFDADRTVIVVSAHDAFDVPTFEAPDPRVLPTQRPWSATAELVGRYVLPRIWDPAPTTQAPPTSPLALPAFATLIAKASAQGPVCVVLHATREEMSGIAAPGYVALMETARNAGGRVIEDRRFLQVDSAFRDNIHLTAAGQQQLAKAIAECS
jgi:hypothetical protein